MHNTIHSLPMVSVRTTTMTNRLTTVTNRQSISQFNESEIPQITISSPLGTETTQNHIILNQFDQSNLNRGTKQHQTNPVTARKHSVVPQQESTQTYKQQNITPKSKTVKSNKCCASCKCNML